VLAELHEARHRADGRGGRVLLQTALIAATARISVRHDGHVAKLARHPDRAAQHSSAGDNAAADPGAEREQHEVSDAPARAHPLFTHGRCVGIVLQNYESVQTAANLVADRKVLEVRKIVGTRDHSFLHADKPGYAEPDARESARAVLFPQL